MDMPFAYLMSCSDSALGDFAVATLNRICVLKKARRELDKDLLELEATSQLVEWLCSNKDGRAKLLRMDRPQESFDFEREPARQLFPVAGSLRGHAADAA
jgi:hypothetical protein